MLELVDDGSASLSTSSTGVDASQQSDFFPTATVLVHRRRGKRGTQSEESRNTGRSYVN